MDKVIDLEKATPKDIVKHLDKYIIGQEKAKKAIAIALRNRIRRKLIKEDIRNEILPKNIIMIGPTGVGKTEIARRISQLSGAPFIKVEATKYTEIGYVGRNVEGIIKDLLNIAINMVKKEMIKNVERQVKEKVDDIIIKKLIPISSELNSSGKIEIVDTDFSNSIDKISKLYYDGKFDDKTITIEVIEQQSIGDLFNVPGMEDMGVAIGGIFPGLPPKKKSRRVTVKEAKKILYDQEVEKFIDFDKVVDIAKDRVENLGIVFIDEIDKIIGKRDTHGPDVSREGVQRDLLPIVEGTTVNTRYGIIRTDHILFIAAGAFSFSKPSDLIPELQGRFPIRVELSSLTNADFKRILTEPENALIKQYEALLATEGVKLSFTEDSLDEISKIAYEINQKTDNIGARRLHTVLEYLLEDISFEAQELSGQEIKIDREFVRKKLAGIIQDNDIMKYIL
ncbi:MAG: ATP-dependent protease ATPase subunit HslU [Spirochaetes bacterium]|nr:ATP-dependent protease ATPase subunit HslU [Spirochaetota bacterium]